MVGLGTRMAGNREADLRDRAVECRMATPGGRVLVVMAAVVGGACVGKISFSVHSATGACVGKEERVKLAHGGHYSH